MVTCPTCDGDGVESVYSKPTREMLYRSDGVRVWVTCRQCNGEKVI